MGVDFARFFWVLAAGALGGAGIRARGGWGLASWEPVGDLTLVTRARCGHSLGLGAAPGSQPAGPLFIPRSYQVVWSPLSLVDRNAVASYVLWNVWYLFSSPKSDTIVTGTWTLHSWPGIEPGPSAVEAWSPNH